MKKLLILTLVLGLASAANADPNGWSLWVAGGNPLGVAPEQEDYYDPGSQICISPGTCLWIGVHNAIQGDATHPRSAFFFLALMDFPAGEWTGNFTQYKPPLVPDAPYNAYYGIYENMDIWVLELTDGNPDHYNGIGVLDAKEFFCFGITDVQVILLDSDLTTVIDTLIIHQISSPILDLSSTEFQFYAVYGGENPSDQILAISNSGAIDETLNWQITEDCDWLTAEPNSGSSTRDPNFVFLSVDIAGLGLGVYDCNLTVSDPDALNNPQTVHVELAIEECYAGMPDYDQWVEVGKPECWCYPRQCHGDADGRKQGNEYIGYWYCGSDDLEIMSLGWLVKDPPKGSGILNLSFNGVPVACADFAHDKQGSAYLGYARIANNDLDLLSVCWMVKEPPHGSPTPFADCLPGNLEP